jgi:hypothetical protein
MHGFIEGKTLTLEPVPWLFLWLLFPIVASMNVNDLLNGGPSQASFDNTSIHISSATFGIIPELSTSVSAPDNAIKSIKSPIAIDYLINYIPPPPLPISITPKPRLGYIRHLGSIKRTPVPSQLYNTTIVLSQKCFCHFLTDNNKTTALQITFDFYKGFTIKSNTTKI